MSNQISESRKMLFINFKFIAANCFNTTTKERVYNWTCENWFSFRLLVQGLLFSAKMDGQVGNLQKWTSSAPISTFKFLAIYRFDDNFTSYGQVSVEPGSPKTTTIKHNIQLVVATWCQLAIRCNFKDWTVSVATNNLVRTNRLTTTKCACKERYNRGSISRKIVALAWFETPLLGFFKLSEAIFFQLLLAVVNSVKMRGRRI